MRTKTNLTNKKKIHNVNVYENIGTIHSFIVEKFQDYNLLIIHERKILMKMMNLSHQSVKDKSSLAVVLSMLNELGLYKVYKRLNDIMFEQTKT